jgi:sulfhydrogenase subunit alpha
MTHRNERALRVAGLARVEGEGAMHVVIEGGRVDHVELEIYEPPRFFEAFLRGRRHTEPPDITARVCGICPVAYQMSACAAIEDACGVDVGEDVWALRRLLYCGEWIQSHALHIYLLHAPDFLGYDGAIEMARDHREIVERGLALKKVGNELMAAIGGRAVHPVNIRVGGFYRAPSRADLLRLRDPLLRARELALETVAWVAGFDFPDFTHDHALLALTRPGTYAIERGTLQTDAGVRFEVDEFEDHVTEVHLPHSTALHARLSGHGTYLTGPAARYTLNSRWLPPIVRAAAQDAGFGDTCRNPYQSVIVRALETLYAVDEAVRLVDGYEPPSPSSVDVPARAGRGYGATEAPRGVLFHRYDLAADGLIEAARIVPPTSQNQAGIEHDLRRFVEDRLDLDDETLTWQCEQAIRNYDPCISCATHFLDLTIERR